LKTQLLQGKRILITAGPTWVPIDKVRVISNIASGETGVLIAEKFLRQGSKVTLLLGPVALPYIKKGIKLVRFKFFDELREKILRELKTGRYDIVIHAAAVSDYRPQKIYSRKVASDRKEWPLKLVPTVKIIDLIKKINRRLFVVGFKFEPGCGRDKLIRDARKLIGRSGATLVVANTTCNSRYMAFIVDSRAAYGPFSNKKKMSEGLIEIGGGKIWKG